MNLEENRKTWGECSYPGDGDCWAKAWGGTDAQWRATVLPRIGRMINDARNIVEIGCGMGRHVCLLYDAARGEGNPDAWNLYLGLDIVKKCVRNCRSKRWGMVDRCIRFYCNDGKSIPLTENDSPVDFVFSWDSLVHADREVMEAYLREIARVLRPGGRAFIHHSNLADCPKGDYPKHARDPGVSAERVRQYVANHVAGLWVVSQELVDWGGCGALIDCFTVLTKGDAIKTRVVQNRDFMAEAHAARRIKELYG